MNRRGRPRHPDILTPREWEVLGLLRRDLTNEQIAERLGISLDGAKYHVSQILSKLDVSSREEAAAWRPEDDAAEKAGVPRLRRWAFAPLALKFIGGAASLAAVAGIGLLAWGIATTDSEAMSRDTALLNAFQSAGAGRTTVFELDIHNGDYSEGLVALSNQVGFTQSDLERTERALAALGASHDDSAWIIHMRDTGWVAYNTVDSHEICADRLFVIDASGFPEFGHAFEFKCPEETASALSNNDTALQKATGRSIVKFCGTQDPVERRSQPCASNHTASTVETEQALYADLLTSIEALGFPLSERSPIDQQGHAWLIRFSGSTGSSAWPCFETAMILEPNDWKLLTNETIFPTAC